MTEVQVGECLNDAGGLVRVRPGTDQDPTREVWIFPDETVATWRKIKENKYGRFDILIRWNGHEEKFQYLERTDSEEVIVKRYVISWKPSHHAYHHLKIYEEV